MKSKYGPLKEILCGLVIVLLLTQDVASKAIDNGLVLTPIKELVAGEGKKLVCGRGALDLMFIVDGSSSIKPPDFARVKNFLAKTVSVFNSDAPDTEDENQGLRVAAIQFSGNPNTEFSFNTFPNAAGAVEYFQDRLRHKGGVTNTGKALKYALDKELKADRGMRPGVPKQIIVFTDGLATDKLETPTRDFHLKKPADTDVIVVGVSRQIDIRQLALIAGETPPDPEDEDQDVDNVYTVDNFDELENVIATLAGDRQCVLVEGAPEQLVDTGESGIFLSCGKDSIVVGSPTRNPFLGQVYVKDHETVPGCMVRGTGENYAGNLTFGLNDCGTRRLRQIDPTPGVAIEATVVFQFHPTVQTKVDQPYSIRCFYMEAEKSVDTKFEVSVLTTLAQQFNFPMPRCSYRVLESYPSGDEVQFALVGDKISHVWTCETEHPDAFKMRVHDCFIESTTGEQAQLIDANGCGIDEILVTTPNYEDDVLTAWVDTHVFKFADKPVITFQCQVSICVDLPVANSADELCPGYPPQCGLEGEGDGEDPDYDEEDGFARKKRSASSSRQFFSLRRPVKYKTDIDNERTMDLASKNIYVADQSDLDYEALAKRREQLSSSSSVTSSSAGGTRKVCLTHMELFLFGILSFGGFVLTAALTVAIHMRNPDEKFHSLF